MANATGIKGYDYVEFYVGSPKMTAFWFAKALGLEITAYRGMETGDRQRTSYYLTKNNLRFVITGALAPENYEVQSFVTRHGDGVKRWSVAVDDVKKAYAYAIEHGAIPVRKPIREEDKQGWVEEAAIKLYDSTEMCFVNRSQYKGIFRPGFDKPVQNFKIRREETGLERIDHIVGNVGENEMDHWASYFNKTLDFETFVDFGPGDISTKYSALLSKVVRSKDNAIKNPINEPYEGVKKSQIEEFIQEYRGSGIQHIAITTPDILTTIRAMRANGVEFLRLPDTYYELLRKKGLKIEEKIDDLQELGILCDDSGEGDGYLLQLFTKPIGDRPTFFFEIIQRRRGSEGFGQGNFQALFESIELDQQRRGNL